MSFTEQNFAPIDDSENYLGPAAASSQAQIPDVATAGASMIRPDDDTSRRVQMIMSAAPQLGGSSMDKIVQLAQGPTTDDAMLSQVNAVMGAAVTHQEAQAIQHMSAQDQAAAWARMTPDQQDAFKAIGYDGTPKVQAGLPTSKGTSLLGHVVGSVWHDVAHEIGAGTHLIGEGLHLLGGPLRDVQHAYRALDYLGTNHQFAGMWQRTSNGERFFTPAAINQANDMLGDQANSSTLFIAQRIAGGDKPEDILSEAGLQAGTQEYSDRFRQLLELTTTPAMQNAVAALNDGKLSLGRDAARTMHIDDPGLFHLVSGAIDAAGDFAGDPLLVLGKISKGYKAAKYGLELMDGAAALDKFGLGAADLAHLDEAAAAGAEGRQAALASGRFNSYYRQLAGVDVNPIQRKMIQVADHFAASRRPLLDELVAGDTKLAKLLPAMTDWSARLANGNTLENLGEVADAAGGITKPSDVVSFINEGTGLQSIAAGKWGSYASRGVEMPHLTRAQSLMVGSKIGMSRTIDFLADGIPAAAFDLDKATVLNPAKGMLEAGLDQFHTGVGTDLALQSSMQHLMSGAQEAIAKILQPPAKIIQGFTTLTPSSGLVQINGEETHQSLSRFLSFAFHGDERADLINRYFEAASPGAKLDVLKGATYSLMDRLGVLNTEGGRQFVDHIVNSSLQSFATNGEDLMQTATGLRHVGIFPKIDQAWAAAIPDYNEVMEMAGQSRKLSMTHALFGSVPANMSEAFLGKVWKPSVLMRIGFIPRVAGEEALGAVARLGGLFLPGRWAGAVAGQPDFVNLAPFRAASDSLRWGIPTEVGAELTAGQQARAMLANYVEATGRVFTPLVRATAGRIQDATTIARTPFHEGLAEGIGRRLAGGQAPEFGAFGDVMRTAMAENRESSAAASLAKFYMRAGRHVGPDGRLITNMDPLELQERIRMAGRFSRLPEVQDAYARALAGAFGHVSSSYANLMIPDDPRITVLERGAPGQDPTALRLKPIGSEFAHYAKAGNLDDGYGLGNILYDHMANWQIGRLADDPTAVAGAQALSTFVSHSQAAEVADKLGGDGFETTRAIREALAEADPSVRRQLATFLHGRDEMDRGLFIDRIDKSGLDNTQAKLLKRFAAKLPGAEEGATDLSTATANMLAVDIDAARGALHQGLDRRLANALADDRVGVPDLVVPHQDQRTVLGLADRNRAQSLADHLEHGDTFARREALDVAVRRRLMQPDMASLRDLAERNQFTADRRAQVAPVPANHARLHVVLADPDEVAKLQQLPRARVIEGISDPETATLVSAMLDEGQRMPFTPEDLAQMRTHSGQSNMSPISSLAVEDPQIAQRLADGLGQALLDTGLKEPGKVEPIVAHTDVHRSLLDLHTEPLAPDLGVYRAKAPILATAAPDVSPVDHNAIIDDWVSHISREIEKRMVSQANGRVLHEVTRPLLDGDWGMEHLARVDPKDLPPTVVGPKYQVAHEGIWSKIVRWGFDKVLGPGIDAMIREPMFAEHFMHALQENAGIEQRFVDPVLADKAKGVLTHTGMDGEAVREAFRDLPLDALRRDGGTDRLPDVGSLRAHLPANLAGLTDRELMGVHAWTMDSASHPEMLAWMESKGINPGNVIDTFAKALPEEFRTPGYADALGADALRSHLAGTPLAGLTDAQLGTLRAWHNNLDAAAHLNDQVAMDRATNEIIPYIHDHHIRSQAAEWTRHFMPFQFAEEQFIKRWARTLKYAPEAFEKGQLMLSGLRHSGVVHKDEYGNDVFYYPGSSTMTNLLGKGIEWITGHPYTIPVSVPLVGDVSQTIPGLNHTGLPGVSPLVGVGLGQMTSRFPELGSVATAIEGERGVHHSVIDQLVPPPVAKTYHFFADDPDRTPKLASASIQAMAMMAAKDNEYAKANNGKHLYAGLDDNANTHDVEQFIERATNWARTMTLVRGILGYGVPASPAPAYQGDLHPYLVRLLGAMPDDPGGAFAEFIKQYPDATPYEVFGTKTTGGAQIPGSKAVENFLNANPGFIGRYPMAAQWMMPQAGTNDEPSRQAYNESIAMGMRIRKTPQEWYDDYKFAAAAPTYFASKDAHDQAMASLKGNTSAVAQERAAYSDWEQQYFAGHPLFKELLLSAAGKQRRDEVLRQTRIALNDPEVPTGTHVDELKNLVSSYDEYQRALGDLSGRRDTSSTRQRNAIADGFNQWVKAYTDEHPDVRAFYQRNIMPDVRNPTDAPPAQVVTA